MTESRDSLSRAADIASVYIRRRSRLLGIFEDEPETSSSGSPLPRTTTVARTGTLGVGTINRGRGGFGIPRGQTGRGWNLSRVPAPGIENTPTRGARRVIGSGRGRATNSILPAWYPRTPLRDITAIVKAIESRRERLGGGEGQEIGRSLPHGLRALDSSESSSVADLKHNTFMSPDPALGVKQCPPTVGKVPEILLDVAHKESGDSELTPQKKLLNSIETVEKQVMEELRNLKRTPIAKKAEREKRVRTLLSMR